MTGRAFLEQKGATISDLYNQLDRDDQLQLLGVAYGLNLKREETAAAQEQVKQNAAQEVPA